MHAILHNGPGIPPVNTHAHMHDHDAHRICKKIRSGQLLTSSDDVRLDHDSEYVDLTSIARAHLLCDVCRDEWLQKKPHKAQSRCRCGTDEPQSRCRSGTGEPQSRYRCGSGEPSTTPVCGPDPTDAGRWRAAPTKQTGASEGPHGPLATGWDARVEWRFASPLLEGPMAAGKREPTVSAGQRQACRNYRVVVVVAVVVVAVCRDSWMSFRVRAVGY